jgi:N-acetylneuraminate synthase
MSRNFKIDNHVIGANSNCFVIAEIGVNHNGKLKMAHELIDAAVNSGANAVKFQTFIAEQLASTVAPKADYQKNLTNSEETQLEMLRSFELSQKDHAELMSHCKEVGIIFLSTPFDETAADMLDDLGVSAFKIGSGDMTNLPLLRHVTKKGKPLLLSTGMSTLDEVIISVKAIEESQAVPLALLHCVSCYPAKPEECNLSVMHTLREKFNVAVGFSDHTLGSSISLAAVALGANVLEKHLTLDRNQEGPDHFSSILPVEFKIMVKSVRDIENSIGDGFKMPVDAELETAAVARKSLVASRNLEQGTILQATDIKILRPGTGLSPSMLEEVIGKTLSKSVSFDDVLTLDCIE